MRIGIHRENYLEIVVLVTGASVEMKTEIRGSRSGGCERDNTVLSRFEPEFEREPQQQQQQNCRVE